MAVGVRSWDGRGHLQDAMPRPDRECWCRRQAINRAAGPHLLLASKQAGRKTPSLRNPCQLRDGGRKAQSV